MRWLLAAAMLLLSTWPGRGELPELAAEHRLTFYCNNVGIFPAHVVAFYPPQLKAKKKHLISDELERADVLAQKLIDFTGDPDVLMLQEIWSIPARDQLVQKLADKYPFVAYPKESIPPPAMMMASGLMLFSKYPLSGFAFHEFTKGIGPDKTARKGIVGAWLHKEGRRVAIFTTHLQAGKTRDDPTIRPDQMGECNQFIRNFLGGEEDVIVILAGDFNTDSSDPEAYATIFRQLPGFRDTYQAGLTSLTQTGRNQRYPDKRIDFMLTRGAQRAVSTIVDPAGPTISDHLGVWGAVELN